MKVGALVLLYNWRIGDYSQAEIKLKKHVCIEINLSAFITFCIYRSYPFGMAHIQCLYYSLCQSALLVFVHIINS